MAFTLQSEIDLVNMALDRIGAGTISLALQSDVKGAACNRNYFHVKESLLRSHEWSFAKERATLSQIKTLTVDVKPSASLWQTDDVLTGMASGTTATVISRISETEYEIAYISGDFADGETITNADDVESVTYENSQVQYEDEDVYVFYDESASQVNCAEGYPDLDAKTPAFKWTYQYMLPDDYKRLIDIYENDGSDLAEVRYEIEGNRILSNWSTMNIRYVKSVTNPDLFDELFKDVLILRLALILSNSLGGTRARELKVDIKEDLKLAEMKARCVASQENNTTGRQDFVLARYDNERG